MEAMKALLLSLLLPLSAIGQDYRYCFTRAELEAAADSALKGQAAVASEAELRQANRRAAQTIARYDKAIDVQDSLIMRQALEKAMLTTRLESANKATLDTRLMLAGCQGQLQESRRITVGGWVVRIGIVALAVKGGHALYQEFKP